MSISILGMRLCCLQLPGSLHMAIAASLTAPTSSPGDQDLIRDRRNRLLKEQQRL